MVYVDGFLLPVKDLKAYRSMATAAGTVWKEHGALEYKECIADDIKKAPGMPKPIWVKLKSGEKLVFSWIVYKSKADRDKINAKVMKDPRLAKYMDPKAKMPFDPKRMSYGGFKVLVGM
jgi:uncharacterized protein YbaA (DUF1428 family)